MHVLSFELIIHQAVIKRFKYVYVKAKISTTSTSVVRLGSCCFIVITEVPPMSMSSRRSVIAFIQSVSESLILISMIDSSIPLKEPRHDSDSIQINRKNCVTKICILYK